MSPDELAPSSSPLEGSTSIDPTTTLSARGTGSVAAYELYLHGSDPIVSQRQCGPSWTRGSSPIGRFRPGLFRGLGRAGLSVPESGQLRRNRSGPRRAGDPGRAGRAQSRGAGRLYGGRPRQVGSRSHDRLRRDRAGPRLHAFPRMAGHRLFVDRPPAGSAEGSEPSHGAGSALTPVGVGERRRCRSAPSSWIAGGIAAAGHYPWRRSTPAWATPIARSRGLSGPSRITL